MRDTKQLFIDCLPIIEKKLKMNSQKPDWKQSGGMELFVDLLGEVQELSEAIEERRPLKEIMFEAVDVAAYALFIIQHCKNKLEVMNADF